MLSKQPQRNERNVVQSESGIVKFGYGKTLVIAHAFMHTRMQVCVVLVVAGLL